MRAGLIAAALAMLLASVVAPEAEEVRSYAKAADYEDVKFELTHAIASRGFSVDFNGQLGKMLERTGPDVGSTKQIYARAEFFAFCSAVFSRRMMEADAGNIGFCPFVIFMYESADKPGETVAGYRRPSPRGNEASQKALAEIDAMLDAIVKESVQ
jgi:uncharacterized protein (DUF302 family)